VLFSPPSPTSELRDRQLCGVVVNRLQIVTMDTSRLYGSWSVEFADGLNLVICNTLFTKQEAKLVTYVAGPVKSTVDYIMVRQEDKAKVRNVKVISSEKCVPKHKL